MSDTYKVSPSTGDTYKESLRVLDAPRPGAPECDLCGEPSADRVESGEDGWLCPACASAPEPDAHALGYEQGHEAP